MNVNKEKNWPQYVGAIGGLLIEIGSFLPWLKGTLYGPFTNHGIDYGNGVVTLILGIFIVLASAVSIAKPKFIPLTPTFLVIVCSFFVVALGVADYMDLHDKVDKISNEAGSASIGAGIYLVIIGGVLGLAGIFNIPKKYVKKTSKRKR